MHFLRSTRRSEIKLHSEFEQTPHKNLRRAQPVRSVLGIRAENSACVKRVVDVESPLDASSANPDDLAESNIELVEPRLEHREGSNQIDRRKAVANGGAATLAKVAAKRRCDGRVGCHIRGLERKSGQVLQHGTRPQAPPRKKVGPVDLELRLGPPPVDLVALVQLLWRIHDEAVVGCDLASAHTTGHQPARSEAGVEADVDEVVDLPLIPESRRWVHYVAHLVKGRRVDVVQSTDRVSTRAGQSWINRCRNEIWIIS